MLELELVCGGSWGKEPESERLCKRDTAVVLLGSNGRETGERWIGKRLVRVI
jgi:hypothetical protein